MAALLQPGQIAALVIHPSADWPAIVADVWSVGGVVMPIDHRLPPALRQELMVRARPAALYDGAWWPVEHAATVGEDVAVVLATSGTEHEPKLVALTHESVRAAVDASARRLALDPSAPWLSCLPLAHIGGLLVVLRSVLLGSPVVVQRGFDVDHFLSAEARYTSLVPTMLRRLVAAGADVSRYDAILVGGAAAAPQDVEQANTRIVQTYGLTESCGGVVYDGVPLDGVQVRLTEHDEVQLRGATIMRGYLDPEKQPFTADGWLRTSDAGVVDERGRLVAVERLDDVIVTGGEKVHPSLVERILRDHPAVADVAVVGRPDAEWGERVLAIVVPRDEMPALDEVREYVAARAPRYCAPRELRRAQSIPRTASGKLRRGVLKPRRAHDAE